MLRRLDNMSSDAEGDEDIEYETITSTNDGPVDRPERLHEWLRSNEIERVHQQFVSHPQGKLNPAELRAVLDTVNITFTDFEYHRLFLKINQNRDFKCDWNEFVSYLIIGFQEDDPSNQKESLILPISMPPVVKKSEHRSPICCISLLKSQCDDVDDDEEENTVPDDSLDAAGMWLTGSKEGHIRFWSPQLDSIRTGVSESIHLKTSTWILAIQALSDVRIVCTASTERELRFHDTAASIFTLRIVIRSMPFAVCSMGYSFHCTGKVHSKLLLGDFGGNVRILEFNPFLRGPFQSKPGAALVDICWSDIVKGKLPLFKTREFLNLHSERIQKVNFSIRMNAMFAAAEYWNTKKNRGRCPGLIVATGDEKTIFRIPLGVKTFYHEDKSQIVVTGGPDTIVRIWDVFIPGKPTGILTGHNSGIVVVFVQPEEKKVYSVDYQKVVKIWHLTEHTLLQTFGDLVSLMPMETDLVYYYHRQMRVLLVGGRKLIAIKCCPRIQMDLTDGNTHSAPVSVVLYNHLFRNVVTCGLDSYIIVWDPWTGRRKIIMKSCHTKTVYGKTVDIEITAACFDPLEQFLLTGARDGSLKIWNYNNADCIRNMSIKREHEVTAVIWVIDRILAVGWDQQVTEFSDVEGRKYDDAKKWPKFHDNDITCADVKLGEGVVTATYAGEIIFWKLETGQPYRKFRAGDPKKFIELKNNRDDEDAKRAVHVNVSRYVRKSISENMRKWRQAGHIGFRGKSNGSEEPLPVSVQAVLCMQTRPMTKEHGSVFVALDTGVIQVYSHHQRGGYMNEFNSIHKTGDCVLTMDTDRRNRFLFTGTAFGYIKIWYIENYCVPHAEKVHVNMPLLRLQFIFLHKERFLTRAKRIVRLQKEPMLVSSYKGHLKEVNSIVYINLPKILLTGSHDCSCRLWSLGGRYLGTLGTPLPWLKLSPYVPVDNESEYRMPPDIRKVASSTTMKVITGVQEDNIKLHYGPSQMADPPEGAQDLDAAGSVYSKPLCEPILGKHFSLPGKSATEQRVELDTSQSYIPVYTHLRIHETKDFERPHTPPAIERVSNESYMDFYKPDETKINTNRDEAATKQARNTIAIARNAVNE